MLFHNKSIPATKGLFEQLQEERFTMASQTAFKFIAAGVLWIIFSDIVVFLLHAPNASAFPIFHVEVLKGIGFVSVMGAFIFFLVKKNQRTIEDVDQLDYFRRNPVPMWIYCPETLRFLEVNDAAVNSYGYSRSEFLTMSLPDIRPEEEVVHLQRALDEIKNGLFYKGTLVHRKKDLTIISAEISAYPIVFKNQSAGLVLSYDVSKVNRLEEQLAQVKQLYEKQLNDKMYEAALYNRELQIRVREINATNDDLISVNKLLLDANKNVVIKQTARQKAARVKLQHYLSRSSHAAWSWNMKDFNERFGNAAAQKLFGVSECIFETDKDFWKKLADPFDQPLIDIHLAILDKDNVVEFTYKLADKEQLVRQRIQVLRDDDEKVLSIEFEAWEISRH